MDNERNWSEQDMRLLREPRDGDPSRAEAPYNFYRRVMLAGLERMAGQQPEDAR